jgi:hypothetical protein
LARAHLEAPRERRRSDTASGSETAAATYQLELVCVTAPREASPVSTCLQSSWARG